MLTTVAGTVVLIAGGGAYAVAGGASESPAATQPAQPASPASANPLTPRAPIPSGGDAAALGISIEPTEAVRNGGSGAVVIRPALVTSSDHLVRDPHLVIRVPRVASVRAAGGGTWRCTAAHGGVACRPRLAVRLASGLEPLNLQLTTGAGRRYGSGTIAAQISWRQRVGSLWPTTIANALQRIRTIPPLTVAARPVDARVVGQIQGDRVDPVVLQGFVGRRTPEPIRYAWRQLCPRTGACPRVRWLSTHTGPLSSPQPDVSFAAPRVARATTLRFELTAWDARGRSSAIVTERVLAQQPMQLDPRLAATRATALRFQPTGRPGRRVALGRDDRAAVEVAGQPVVRLRPGQRIRLVADVAGEKTARVKWKVIRGPPNLLSRARRRGNTLILNAPTQPGTYVVRLTVYTRHAVYTRDGTAIVEPTARQAAAEFSPQLATSHRRAAAAADDARRQAFCSTLGEARSKREVTIPFASGGSLTAAVTEIKGNAGCDGTETISFDRGHTILGEFELEGLTGTITLEHGLAIRSGRLIAPVYWSESAPKGLTRDAHVLRGAAASRAARAHAAGIAPSIGFELPTVGGISAALGVRLGPQGWSDFAGSVTVDQNALSKLPIADSLPTGWKLSSVSLSLAPEAGQLELEGVIAGPKNTGGDASIVVTGTLTFQGIARLSVVASNLAVLQGDNGQTTVSGAGELDIDPAQEYQPDGGGRVFAQVDASVFAKIENYAPAPGLTLSGQVSWSTSGPLEVSGTLTAKAKGQDITADVTGTYTSASDWTLHANLVSTTGVRVGNLLTLESLSGKVSRGGNGITIDLNGSVRDVAKIPGVTISKASAALSTSSCDFAGPLAHTARAHLAAADTNAKPVCLSIGADLGITVPGATKELQTRGRLVIDLATLKFSVSGEVPAGDDFGPAALRLRSVRVWATNAPAAGQACSQTGTGGEGLSFGFEASGRIAGLELHHVGGAYLANGQYCLSADIGSAMLPGTGGGNLTPAPTSTATGCASPSAPALQGLRVSYSSADKLVKLHGRFCLPQSLRTSLGRIGEGSGSVELKLDASGGSPALDGRITYTLDQPYWLIGGNSNGTAPLGDKAALGLKSAGLHLVVNPTALELSLEADGALRMPKPANAAQFGGSDSTKTAEAAVHVDATASLGANPGFSVTVRVGEGSDQACTRQRAATTGITNLFGQQGLDVCSVGLTGKLDAAPSLAASASFILPDAWGKELGITNASYALGFNVSATNPCFDLRISQIDSKKPAIDLFNKGVVKANSVHLAIAPTGCKLPDKLPGQTSDFLEPGFELSFNGAVMSTPVDLFAAIKKQGASFSIDVRLKVGAFNLGPVTFDKDTTLAVFADPANRSFRFTVKTSVKLGNSFVNIDADFSTSPGNIELHARDISVNFDLLLAKFNGQMTLDFVQTPTRTKVDFSGTMHLDILVMTIDVNVSKLTYDSAAGGLQELDVSVNQGFKLGPAEGNIAGSVVYSRAKAEIGLRLSGRVRLWGFVTSFDLPAKLTTNVSLPFDFGPGADTTTISKPGSLLVLRLKGKLDGRVNRNGTVTVDHVMPIQGCFPFETVCVTIGDAKVNTSNGTVTFKVFSFDVVIDAKQYIKPPPAQVDYSPGVAFTVNDESGKCLDVHHGDFKAGTRLWQYDCSRPNKSQEFRLLSDGTLRTGDNSRWCVSGKDRQPQLADCNHQPVQIWYRDEQGRIRGSDGKDLNLCLDVAGHSKASQAYTTLTACTGKDKSERWVMDGLLRREGEGCLDVPQGDVKAELAVFHHCNGTENQAFALYPNGELKVRGLCVEASKTYGAAVRLAGCTGSVEQRWGLRSGQLCIGKMNDFGFDARDAQCMASKAKQGEYYPVRVAGYSRNSGAYFWQLTY